MPAVSAYLGVRLRNTASVQDVLYVELEWVFSDFWLKFVKNLISYEPITKSELCNIQAAIKLLNYVNIS